MSDTADHNVPSFELRHRLNLALEFAGMKPHDMALLSRLTPIPEVVESET